MKNRFYKELWNIRFKKMLDLEEQSASAYQSLLDECKRTGKGQAVMPYLEKLITDEKRHARLAKELLRILARQDD